MPRCAASGRRPWPGRAAARARRGRPARRPDGPGTSSRRRRRSTRCRPRSRGVPGPGRGSGDSRVRRRPSRPPPSPGPRRWRRAAAAGPPGCRSTASSWLPSSSVRWRVERTASAYSPASQMAASASSRSPGGVRGMSPRFCACPPTFASSRSVTVTTALTVPRRCRRHRRRLVPADPAHKSVAGGHRARPAVRSRAPAIPTPLVGFAVSRYRRGSNGRPLPRLHPGALPAAP